MLKLQLFLLVILLKNGKCEDHFNPFSVYDDDDEKLEERSIEKTDEARYHELDSHDQGSA